MIPTIERKTWDEMTERERDWWIAEKVMGYRIEDSKGDFSPTTNLGMAMMALEKISIPDSSATLWRIEKVYSDRDFFYVVYVYNRGATRYEHAGKDLCDTICRVLAIMTGIKHNYA